MTTGNNKLLATALAAVLVLSVFAGAAVTVAGAAAGNVDLSINSAGDTATVTVNDADLNTDSGSKQSLVVNVVSDSEGTTRTKTTSSDTKDGMTQTVSISPSLLVADRNKDNAITKADFTLNGASDESITGVTFNDGAYEVTISDAGPSKSDGNVEVVSYTKLSGAQTSDTADSDSQTITTNGPVADRNRDGAIDANDVALVASAGDESITGFTLNNDGTADVTITDSGSGTTDGNKERLTYLGAETATLTETGQDTGSFTGSLSIAQTDSAGVLYALDGDSVVATYWDGGTTKRTAFEKLSVSDSTAPTISNVKLENDGSGNLKLTFDSGEQLGTAASDLSVTVDGPSTTDVYAFDRDDFMESGSGPYTYTLVTTQAYDDGDGTYTATVDTAKDGAGNDGGGSGQTDMYSYSSGPSPAVQSSSLAHVGGTQPTMSDVKLDAFFAGGMLQVQLKDKTADTTDKQFEDDYDISDLGAAADTQMKVSVTVSNYTPRAMVGSAHDVSWTRTDNGDGTWTITVTGKPAELYQHFEDDGSSPNFDGTVQANAHVDKTITYAISDLSFLSSTKQTRMDGLVMMTDAQSFGAPQYSESKSGADKVTVSLSAPHFDTDGNVNAGFFEAYIPQAMLDHWGVTASGLTASFGNQNPQVTVSDVAGGGAQIDFSVHYSSGTAEVTADTADPTASTGSDRTVDEDTSVDFDGSGSSDNNQISSYAWDFDGDGTTDATGATPSHTFSTPGTYTVTLTVTDAAGNTDTATVTITVSDVTAPTATVGSDATVDAGASVSFDASGSTDNAGVTSYAWDFDGDGATDATGATASHTFSSAGTYDVTLTVTDAAGNTDTATRTVTVEAAGGGGSGDGSEAQKQPVAVTVDAGQANVHVREPSSEMSIGLGDVAGAANVSTNALSFDTDATDEFTLNVSVHDAAPDGTPSPDGTDVGTALGFVQVDHSIDDAEISALTMRFSVPWETITGGVHEDDLVLYRYHDGEWVAQDTTILRYTSEGIVLEADLDGMSVFAVGTERVPALGVGAASVETETVTAGESVTVSTTVTNTGTASGSTTVALGVDGAARDTATVTLAPGESRTVDLSTTFDAAGTYDLAVNGTAAGSVTVESAATATPAPTPTPTVTPTPTATSTQTATPAPTATPVPDATDTASADGPGFGPVAALLALVVSVLALARRRR